MTLDNIDQGAFLPNSGFPDWREIMLNHVCGQPYPFPGRSGSTGLTILTHMGEPMLNLNNSKEEKKV